MKRMQVLSKIYAQYVYSKNWFLDHPGPSPHRAFPSAPTPAPDIIGPNFLQVFDQMSPYQ